MFFLDPSAAAATPFSFPSPCSVLRIHFLGSLHILPFSFFIGLLPKLWLRLQCGAQLVCACGSSNTCDLAAAAVGAPYPPRRRHRPRHHPESTGGRPLWVAINKLRLQLRLHISFLFHCFVVTLTSRCYDAIALYFLIHLSLSSANAAQLSTIDDTFNDIGQWVIVIVMNRVSFVRSPQLTEWWWCEDCNFGCAVRWR